MNKHPSNDELFISKLTEIILANLGNENFGVNELAREVGISHYVLGKRLKKIIGKTINQLIREIRLSEALEMLKNEELTASEVAYKTGFGSPTYFNSCFHEFFGYPPGTIKKGDIDDTAKKDTPQDLKQPDKRRSNRRTIFMLWAGILFLIVLFFLGHILFFRSPSLDTRKSQKSWEKSLAVLPFKNLSDSTANLYFIDGVMDEILTNLSSIHALRVISRTSVEQFRETTRSANDIAKILNVDYIVEGSGQKYGNKFRLRVQLVDASKDRHIWAESYEQEIMETKDIFKIQSQVAKTIASELKATITSEEKQLIEKKPTSNLMAYDFYLRGEEELRKYFLDNSNKKALKRAAEMYRNALEYDSLFALAYIGLSHVYGTKDYFRSYYSENFLDSVLILADIALSYDQHLADGYYWRAVYYINNGNTGQALKEYDKTLKYNPNYWQAYWNKGWNVYILDLENADYVKAIECFEKALSINHGLDRHMVLRSFGNAYAFYLGFPEKAKYCYQEAFRLHADSILYLSDIGGLEIQYGNFEEGIEKGLKAYAIDSNNTDLIHNLGVQYFYHRQYKESLKYFKKYTERLTSIGQLPLWRFLQVGYAYWQNGYKKEAEYWFNEQRRLSMQSIKLGRVYRNDDFDGAYSALASLYAFSGEKEKAYEILRMISRKPVLSYSLVIFLKTYNPFYDNIRNEPEFQKIVKEVESKYQAEHERVRKWLEERGETLN